MFSLKSPGVTKLSLNTTPYTFNSERTNQRTQFHHVQFRVSLKGLKADFMSYRTSPLSPWSAFINQFSLEVNFNIMKCSSLDSDWHNSSTECQQGTRWIGWKTSFTSTYGLWTQISDIPQALEAQGISRAQNCLLKNTHHLKCKADHHSEIKNDSLGC